MTGWRKLGRDSEHRQALLRNLVTSLVRHEAIETTWHKAKEAQRVAEKLITLAKRNTEVSRRMAQGVLFTPHELLPKLFGEIRERYAERSGGYTRVLHTESQVNGHPVKTAILELVDGPKDMRFAMTAAAVARDRKLGREHTDITKINIAKVIQFRDDGEKRLESMVQKLMGGNYISRLSAPDRPLGPSGGASLGIGSKKAREAWSSRPRSAEEQERLAIGKQERRERRQAAKEGSEWKEQLETWEEGPEGPEGEEEQEQGGGRGLPRWGGRGARSGKDHQSADVRNGGSSAMEKKRGNPYGALEREAMRKEEREKYKRWGLEELEAQEKAKEEKGWVRKSYDAARTKISPPRSNDRKEGWQLPRSDKEP